MLGFGGINRLQGLKSGDQAWLHVVLRAAALGSLLLVSACGGSDKIEVDRSAALSAEANSAAFIVLPAKGQDRAPDFAKYADRIAGQLTAKGMTRVDDPAKARYALMFSYDGDGMATASEDRRRGHVEKKGDDNKALRTASITIYDLTRPHWPDEVVFGGTAQCSVDLANHDPTVMASVIDSILKDFPGDRHETYSVSLPSSK